MYSQEHAHGPEHTGPFMCPCSGCLPGPAASLAIPTQPWSPSSEAPSLASQDPQHLAHRLAARRPAGRGSACLAQGIIDHLCLCGPVSPSNSRATPCRKAGVKA